MHIAFYLQKPGELLLVSAARSALHESEHDFATRERHCAVWTERKDSLVILEAEDSNTSAVS